ncbi:MAG: response regulator MprA [Parcubacteria group bacterium]|nr:response regulator MprA [Parcubacteria group bacterium]
MALIALAGWFWYHPLSMSYKGLSVFPTATTTPSSPISFEVVTTTADQERGLGGRTNIPPDYGMLFVFPKDDTYGFWMKDMLAPIDIIWLSDTDTIVYLRESVAPSTYPHVFYPDSPARYVLEMRDGQASARGWKIGTHVQLPLPYGK